MAFNASIPTESDDPSVSQGQLLINFTQLNTIFGNNHITYDAASDNGKHSTVVFVEGIASATASNEIGLYAEDTGTQPDLFVRPESNGTAQRLSGGGITSAAYCTFDAAAVLTAGSFNVTSTVLGAGIYTITFTRSFDNTNYIAMVIGYHPSGGTITIEKVTKNVGAFTFEISGAAPPAATTLDCVFFGILA